VNRLQRGGWSHEEGASKEREKKKKPETMLPQRWVWGVIPDRGRIKRKGWMYGRGPLGGGSEARRAHERLPETGWGRGMKKAVGKSCLGIKRGCLDPENTKWEKKSWGIGRYVGGRVNGVAKSVFCKGGVVQKRTKPHIARVVVSKGNWGGHQRKEKRGGEGLRGI